jgi:5-formyltetrahydrofolate cyclo-ligase
MVKKRLAETVQRIRNEGLPDPRQFKAKSNVMAQLEKLPLRHLVTRRALLDMSVRQEEPLRSILERAANTINLPMPEGLVRTWLETEILQGNSDA